MAGVIAIRSGKGAITSGLSGLTAKNRSRGDGTALNRLRSPANRRISRIGATGEPRRVR